MDFERSTTESLTALGIDQADLLMVHWPLPTMDLAATIGALAQMKRRGFTRHIGVANFNLTLLEEAIRLGPEPLTALQAEFHPLLDQSRMIAACRRRGLAFISYCPLARGRILDEPLLLDIAAAHGKSVPQVALRWLIDHEGVCAIPSSGSVERVAANIDIFDFALTADERAADRRRCQARRPPRQPAGARAGLGRLGATATKAAVIRIKGCARQRLNGFQFRISNDLAAESGTDFRAPLGIGCAASAIIARHNCNS